jgi:Iap family predicted aminopeptidase
MHFSDHKVQLYHHKDLNIKLDTIGEKCLLLKTDLELLDGGWALAYPMEIHCKVEDSWGWIWAIIPPVTLCRISVQDSAELCSVPSLCFERLDLSQCL